VAHDLKPGLDTHGRAERELLDAWRESIATTFLMGGDAAMVRAAAELVPG
jgi:hypothetical protein